MTRINEHDDRDSLDTIRRLQREVHRLSTPTRREVDKDNNKVNHTRQHKEAKVPEAIQTLRIRHRHHNNIHHNSPEDAALQHPLIELLAALIRTAAGADAIRALTVLHAVDRILHQRRERVTKRDDERYDDTDGDHEHDEFQEDPRPRRDAGAHPCVRHLRLGGQRVLLHLLLLAEGDANLLQHPHRPDADQAEEEDEDRTRDEAELVQGVRETEDAGAEGGADDAHVAGEDGGELLELGDGTLVSKAGRAGNLDNVVVRLDTVVGCDHPVGRTLEFNLVFAVYPIF